MSTGNRRTIVSPEIACLQAWAVGIVLGGVPTVLGVALLLALDSGWWVGYDDSLMPAFLGTWLVVATIGWIGAFLVWRLRMPAAVERTGAYERRSPARRPRDILTVHMICWSLLAVPAVVSVALSAATEAWMFVTAGVVVYWVGFYALRPRADRFGADMTEFSAKTATGD